VFGHRSNSSFEPESVPAFPAPCEKAIFIIAQLESVAARSMEFVRRYSEMFHPDTVLAGRRWKRFTVEARFGLEFLPFPGKHFDQAPLCVSASFWTKHALRAGLCAKAKSMLVMFLCRP
jgi:hypothetical protein